MEAFASYVFIDATYTHDYDTTFISLGEADYYSFQTKLEKIYADDFIAYNVLVNGKVCDRASMRLKAGDVISINEQHSPMIAKFAKESTAAIPPYIEKDANDKCKATIVREPLPEEIHVDVSIIKVVEYYNLH